MSKLFNEIKDINIKNVDLENATKVHNESVNVRLSNFGGPSNDYVKVLNEVKDVLTNVEQLSELLKKTPTITYRA